MALKVVILRGISGAGKSTYTSTHYPNALVVSADFFFGTGSEYKFNPAKLKAAHQSCFQTFAEALKNKVETIVVDNTNTTRWELKRYYDLASQQGYNVDVIRLTIDPAIAALRNVHGVPVEKVYQMQARFEDFPGEVVIDNTPVKVA